MPASDQRIRQVAIVLQSLDASTAKSLLAQLPADLARQVKLAMVKLGNVSSTERAEAMLQLEGLFGKESLQPPKTKSRAATSPATAILRELGEEDQLEWSNEVTISSPPANFSVSAPPPSETPWLAWDPQSLANLLANERPTVIATVLNQLSPERAKLLLDHLPVETAGATLSAIPNLFLVDPSILNDILAEVERKLPKQPPSQTTASIAGIAKLAAIVDQFEPHQKQAWLNAIAAQNRDVALQLGWEDPALSSFKPSRLPPTDKSTPDLDEKAPAPILLPIDAYRNEAIDAILAPSSDSPSSQVGTRTFDDLLQLNDGDLVTLLHSCNRLDVLRAISHASAAMKGRIERLVPSQDMKKFRDYLKRYPSVPQAESKAAQDAILEKGSQLMERGRIRSLLGFTFAAAA